MNRWSIFFVFALLPTGTFAQEGFFSGEWDGSEHVYLRQVGHKVCGLWRHIATGREYEGRLIGTAIANHLKIDQVCGTPGGRSSTYCAGAAPKLEANVGWNPSEEGALVCNRRLLVARDMPLNCPARSQTATWDDPVSGIAARNDSHTFAPIEVAWALECAGSKFGLTH